MEFEGNVIVVWEEEKIWENQIPKRTLVIEEDTDREYKGSMAVEFFRDKAELLSDINVGDKVKVWLNFRSREYNWRYFNTISGWRIEKVAAGASAGTSSDDDLPF